MKLITSNGDALTVNPTTKNASQATAFERWLEGRFAEPTRLTASVIVAVGNKFDELKAQGRAIFRGDLIDFLWNRQGQTVRYAHK